MSDSFPFTKFSSNECLSFPAIDLYPTSVFMYFFFCLCAINPEFPQAFNAVSLSIPMVKGTPLQLTETLKSLLAS